MKTPRPVTHIVFDVDGLILDTESLLTIAANNVCAKYGKHYTWEMKVKVMGTTGPESARRLLKLLDMPESVTVESWRSMMKQETAKLFPDAQLMPGAERLIRHLHKHNIPIAVATSSATSSLELKMQNHKELFSLFHHIVSGTADPEVKQGKPAPDIFLCSIKKFEDSPASNDQVLIFEDAPNGVKAALAAGCQVIMVPDPRLIHKAAYDATLCIGSLNQFQPELFGLPPFDDVPDF